MVSGRLKPTFNLLTAFLTDYKSSLVFGSVTSFFGIKKFFSKATRRICAKIVDFDNLRKLIIRFKNMIYFAVLVK